MITFRTGTRDDVAELMERGCPAPQNIDDVSAAGSVQIACQGALPVGYGTIGQTLHGQPLKPGQVFIQVAVAPGQRRQRVGRALFEQVLAQVREQGATSIASSAEPEDQGSLVFAAALGFTVDYEMYECELDLEAFDTQAWTYVLDEAAAKGIRFSTLAEVLNPEAAARAVYRLDEELSRDVPEWSGYMPPFEEYRADLMASPDAVFLAYAGDELVGMCSATAEEDGTAYWSFLGVKRTHRGYGIAAALKVLSIRWAQQLGLKRYLTHNNAASTPIVALNRKFGCEVRRSAVYLIR